MKASLLFPGLLLVTGTLVKAVCPPNFKIQPCSCEGSEISEPVTVRCPGFTSIWELAIATKGLKPHPGFYGTNVSDFTIERSTMMYLLDDLFDELFIRNLNLEKSTFVSLSNNATAFKGLENSLEVLTVVDCSFMSSWNWTKLQYMKKLRKIHVMSGDMLIIDENMDKLSHLPITDLSFNRNFIFWMHDTAFANFHSLRTLTLHHNELDTIKRSMFPSPAKSLVLLDLSYNNIQTLPKDIFSDMPRLTDLALNHNRLLILSEEVFSPVWKQLEVFGTLGNPVSCDCRMIWLTNLKFNTTTHRADCSQPERLKGRTVDTLAKSELWC